LALWYEYSTSSCLLSVPLNAVSLRNLPRNCTPYCTGITRYSHSVHSAVILAPCDKHLLIHKLCAASYDNGPMKKRRYLMRGDARELQAQNLGGQTHLLLLPSCACRKKRDCQCSGTCHFYFSTATPKVPAIPIRYSVRSTPYSNRN
jgi:hypothetical protein